MSEVVSISARRAIEERIIPKLGTRALKLPVDSARRGSGDPFAELALRKHSAFVQAAAPKQVADAFGKLPAEQLDQRVRAAERLAGSDGVKHGFLVCGYLLGHAPIVMTHARMPHEQKTARNLGAILTHPRTIEKTLLHLAMMPDAANSVWEEALGITGSGYDLSRRFNYTTLEMRQDESGMWLGADAIEAYRTSQEVATLGNIEPGHCPAHRFLPVLWNDMVQEAVTDPQLFDAELKRLSVQ